MKFFKAQEDTEVLKSLVIPLEEKIQDLTNKLQAAEQKLKKYESESTLLSSVSAFEKKKLEDCSSDLLLNASQENANHFPEKVDTKKLGDNQGSLINLDGNSEQMSSTLNSSVATKSVSCDMCSNYEAQLVSQQKLNAVLRKEKEKIEANMQKLKDDFVRETQFRKTMEDKWNEKKEKHKAKVCQKLHFNNEFDFNELENF